MNYKYPIFPQGKSISKNFEIDEHIVYLEDLAHHLDSKKAIYVHCWSRIHPSVWIRNMSFHIVKKWMNNNNFYTIKRKTN